MNSNTALIRKGGVNVPSSQRLPWVGLLALAMAGFICILTEGLPAGLLPQIAQDLGVTEALAGQSVTLYAVGSLLAAIPLTTDTRKWRPAGYARRMVPDSLKGRAMAVAMVGTPLALALGVPLGTFFGT